MRTFIGLFVVAHGLVTVAIWAMGAQTVPEGNLQPPDPTHSWLLGDARTLSMVFGVAVGIALVVAGIGFLLAQSWWPALAVAAGIGSLLLFAVFFTPWWLAGIAISSTLIVGALRAVPVA